MHSFLRKYSCIPLLALVSAGGCSIPNVVQRDAGRAVPAAYSSGLPGANNTATPAAAIPWRTFFTDPYLQALIDTALHNNQELLGILQELEIARNEIRARQGDLLPTVGVRAGAGLDKVGRYTSTGAGDAATDIVPGREVPGVLGDFSGGLYATWEVDIWKKLRTAKKAATARYLATVEGKNFLLTSLIAEVANSYYELLGLDNQLAIVRQTIALQQNALEVIKVQKQAARATELAVQKFEAEVAGTQSRQYSLLQQITETENRINLLLARYPQPVPRDTAGFLALQPPLAGTGIPAQLLANRPDVRRAELNLSAAKLDVQVARKAFYPSVGITAGVGLGAFNPAYLVRLPESLVFSLAGDLAAPLINRNAIKAAYYTASARQLQAVYDYERAILNSYLEVSTQLARIDNLGKSYDLKARQAAALTRSVSIANDLFGAARADYLEVLMTQRDALEARLELVETKRQVLSAGVDMYKDLGGGWQ